MLSKAVLFASPDRHKSPERSPKHSRPAQSRPALLPVGNKPLMLHALEELVDAGIDEVAVVTPPSLADEVHELLAGITDAMATSHVVGGDSTFADALARVVPFVANDPFVVHLGDSLSHGGLAEAIQAPPLYGNDALALVEEHGDQVTPLGAGLAHRHAAGVYVFGPGVLDLVRDGDVADDIDREIAAVAARLAGAGGHVELRSVQDRWRYRERPDTLLQANRFYLAGLTGGHPDASLENVDLQGPVVLHPTARLVSTTVRGPVIIGPGVEVSDAYVGPYTSIGPNVVIENAEVENSIILPGASIRHLGGRLEASIVGPHARICRDFRLPRALRVNVGEGAHIAIT
jgi:glucose-1-phosphate thymidylyltransferase